MPAPSPEPRVVRFGVFELDLRTGELRKKGVKVSFQEQPFKVLALLVSRPGELVTREELRQKLWPDAVFLDFDHGLNKAVGKIRRALGDFAESPRFVETLERRGYRFITAVEPVAAGSVVGSVSTVPSDVRVIWNDRAIPLGHGTHLIGRDPASVIWIDSSYVSRQHARLVIDDGVTLEDLGSHNGTLVNGSRIARACRLNDGDEIVIGPARLIVRVSVGGGSTATAPR